MNKNILLRIIIGSILIVVSMNIFYYHYYNLEPYFRITKVEEREDMAIYEINSLGNYKMAVKYVNSDEEEGYEYYETNNKYYIGNIEGRTHNIFKYLAYKANRIERNMIMEVGYKDHKQWTKVIEGNNERIIEIDIPIDHPTNISFLNDNNKVFRIEDDHHFIEATIELAGKYIVN